MTKVGIDAGIGRILPRKGEILKIPILILSLTLLGSLSSNIQTFAQDDNLEFEYEEEDDGYFTILNSIRAQTTNGNVTGISADPDFNSILVTLETNSSDGTLRMILPRVAIDAKNGTEDARFTVVVDSVESAYNEIRTNETEREILVSIPAGTIQVEIVGTQVVPEFPIALLGGVAALVGAIAVLGRTRIIRRMT